jgi:hypothetical protein
MNAPGERRFLERVIRKLPIAGDYLSYADERIESLSSEVESLSSEAERLCEEVGRLERSNDGILFPPGHYYSPIVSRQEVEADHGRIFGPHSAIPAVDLNEDGQLSLLEDLA